MKISGSTSKRATLPEFRTLLALALPIMTAQMLQMGMMVLDTVMVGRLSSTHLAGIALGVNVMFPLLMLVTGVVMGVTPMVAQLNGADQAGKSGAVIRQGMWLVVTGACFLLLVMNNIEPVFRWVGVDESAIPIGVDYLRAYSIGMPGLLGYFLLRYLCEGLGRTIPAMIVAGCALPLKALLNYAFINGKFGAPELGGAGCGWSSAIVCWFEFFAILYVVRRPFYEKSKLFEKWSWPNIDELKRIVAIGLPIGITQFLEMAVFSGVGILVGTLGAQTLAAHSIASNINGITFMIPVSLGIACTIRVGFHVGAQQFDAAKLTARVAVYSALLFALTACIALAVFRTELASLYSKEQFVIATAANVLLIVAAYQFFDDTQIVAMGILRGFKDTRVPMYFALFGYWLVCLPVGCAIAFGWLGIPEQGLYGFWYGLSLGLLIVTILLFLRVRWLFSNIERFAPPNRDIGTNAA